MTSEANLPSLNGLRAFSAAGRHMSFRAAAEELGVTQGAVGQQVRGLEEHLGLRLFLREPRGLSFTEEGRSYHAAVSRAFSQLMDATGALLDTPSRVTISVTPTFSSKWLIPRLGAIMRVELLFPQEVIAVCSPHLVAPEIPLDAAALSRLSLLHDAHDLWPQFLEIAFGAIPKAPRGLHFSQTTLSLDAALAGQGVALASRFLVQRDLEAGRLVDAVHTALEGGQDFYALLSRQGASEAAIRVMEWLLSMAQEEIREE